MPKQANTTRKNQPLGASQSQIQKGGNGYETNKDRQMLLRKYRKEVMDFGKKSSIITYLNNSYNSSNFIFLI